MSRKSWIAIGVIIAVILLLYWFFFGTEIAEDENIINSVGNYGTDID